MAKRALLIGVNKYRIPGNDLRGCVNDVRAMQEILVTRYGFLASDMKVLTDGQATTAAIRTGIANLVKTSKKGDVVVVHYSGHGSQVPDANGDEADRRDEIICPSDLDWSDPITDDWIRTTLNKLKAGVALTVVFDCCHSGSATRAPMNPNAETRPRYLPCPLDLMATESGRKLTGRRTGRLRDLAPKKGSRAAAKKASDNLVADLPEVLVSGCRDNQTSADAFIGGRPQGALTACLLEALSAAGPAASAKKVLAATRDLLKQRGFDQVPQLTGRAPNLDAPLFMTTAVGATTAATG